MSDVVRIDISISFLLSKLSNAKFSILYDISLVRDWKRKLKLITPGSERVKYYRERKKTDLKQIIVSVSGHSYFRENIFYIHTWDDAEYAMYRLIPEIDYRWVFIICTRSGIMSKCVHCTLASDQSVFLCASIATIVLFKISCSCSQFCNCRAYFKVPALIKCKLSFWIDELL